MYKSNMYEFVERVSGYTQRNFGVAIYLDTYARKANTAESWKDFIIMTKLSDTTKIGYWVFDREDFEDQVYDIVNKLLSNSKKVDLEVWTFRI